MRVLSHIGFFERLRISSQVRAETIIVCTPKGCGRQFLQAQEQCLISADTRALIEGLLLEWLSLRGILSRRGR